MPQVHVCTQLMHKKNISKVCDRRENNNNNNNNNDKNYKNVYSYKYNNNLHIHIITYNNKEFL